MVFTTRTGLALHAPLVDLLHLMGASDRYIAGQFQRHALRLALRGGAIGLIMSLVAYGALRLALERAGVAPGPELMPGFRLPLAAAGSVLVLPLLMGGVAMLTARITVLRSLARMP